MAEPLLPDAELEVLACLWKYGPLTARAIREKMQRYRPMTHSAVSTLLARLQKKGRVTRAKGPVGKAFVFRAAVPPGNTYRLRACFRRFASASPRFLIRAPVRLRSACPMR